MNVELAWALWDTALEVSQPAALAFPDEQPTAVVTKRLHYEAHCVPVWDSSQKPHV